MVTADAGARPQMTRHGLRLPSGPGPGPIAGERSHTPFSHIAPCLTHRDSQPRSESRLPLPERRAQRMRPRRGGP